MASIEESLLLLSSSASAEIDLAALVETHSALLFRVAHSLLRSHAEAEDVVQDTFLRVLQRPASLPNIRDHRVWLVRIAWNLALDRLRRRKSRPADSEFVDSLIAPATPADRASKTYATFRPSSARLNTFPRSSGRSSSSPYSKNSKPQRSPPSPAAPKPPCALSPSAHAPDSANGSRKQATDDSRPHPRPQRQSDRPRPQRPPRHHSTPGYGPPHS